MVWPIVKEAIENSIRKVDCTVSWKHGNIHEEFKVQTFWTDPVALTQLPQAGGEFTEQDDPSGSNEEGGEGGTDPGGAPGGSSTAPRPTVSGPGMGSMKGG
jgi:hypothetical protein